MKKLLFILTFIVGLNFASKAQYYDHALGIRGGTSLEVSYKRFIFYTPSIQQAIEGLIGFQIDELKRTQNGWVFEALYHFHLDLGFDTGFSGFAGIGGYIGVFTEHGKKPYLGGGATMAIGASYTFTHAPVNIAIDWKPILGFPRMSLTRGAVTLRYVFPTTWQ
ncbi:MAG: hypothetical protein GY810_21710 [Aureispira sp.]|nr:hypothetical protein [Aureispira sp.]